MSYEDSDFNFASSYNGYRSTYKLPYQRIPMSDKYADDKQWFKDTIDALVPSGYGYEFEMPNAERVLRNYRLYNNIIEQKDIQEECGTVTGVMAIDVGQFDKKIIPYNISNRKIDKLIGEHGKRGFNPSVYLVNPHDIKSRDDEWKQRVKESVKQRIDWAVFQQSPEFQQMSPEERKQHEERIISTESPDNLDKRRYLSQKQILGNQQLDLMKLEERIAKKRRVGFKHALLSDKEMVFVGQNRGMANIHVLNPLRSGYIKSPEEDMIHRGLAAWYRIPMYIQDVLDNYGHYLSKDDFEILAQRLKDNHGGYGSRRDMRGKKYASNDDRLKSAVQATISSNGAGDAIGSHGTMQNQDEYCWFTYVQWRGNREVGFHKFMNEYGDMETEIVDKDFTIPNDATRVEYVSEDGILNDRYEWINEWGEPESISYEWINRTYEGIRIDEDIYGMMREMPNQYTSIRNPYESHLTFFGTTFNETNAYSISYMDRMRPFQYLYFYIIDKIKELTAKEQGMVSAYDTTQIDPELADEASGRDALQMQLYYESTHSAVYYNSLLNRYTGQQAVQRPAGFTTVVKSNAQFVQYYMQLASWCEEQIGNAGAVTAHREGQTAERDGVGNVRQNVIASSDITEHYFQTDNEIWQEVTQCYISISNKLLSKQLDAGEEHIVSYVLPDESIETLRMTKDDIEDADLGIFVTNSSAEREFMQRLDGYTQLLISNDKLLAEDITNILEAMALGKSMYQVKHLLAGSEKRRHDRKLEEIDKQNEAQKQAQEAATQLEDKRHGQEIEKIQVKGAEDRKTMEVKIEGDLQKAAVVATGFDEEKDRNNNQIADPIDTANMYIEQSLKKQDLDIKQADMNLKREGVEVKKAEMKARKSNINKPK